MGQAKGLRWVASQANYSPSTLSRALRLEDPRLPRWELVRNVLSVLRVGNEKMLFWEARWRTLNNRAISPAPVPVSLATTIPTTTPAAVQAGMGGAAASPSPAGLGPPATSGTGVQYRPARTRFTRTSRQARTTTVLTRESFLQSLLRVWSPRRFGVRPSGITPSRSGHARTGLVSAMDALFKTVALVTMGVAASALYFEGLWVPTTVLQWTFALLLFGAFLSGRVVGRRYFSGARSAPLDDAPRSAGTRDWDRAVTARSRPTLLSDVAQHLAVHFERVYWEETRRIRGAPIGVPWRLDTDRALPLYEQLSGGSQHVVPQGLTQGTVVSLYPLYCALRYQRLVILGAAHSGKSTAMTLLMLEALDARRRHSGRQKVAVPVRLSLVNWNAQQQSLTTWLSSTLRAQAPHPLLEGGSPVIEPLLAGGHIALFLDGLNEMPPEQRAVALAEIDRSTRGMHVTITSRREAYEDGRFSGQSLTNATVIEMNDVDPMTATRYLTRDIDSPTKRGQFSDLAEFINRVRTTPVAKAISNP